MVRPGAMPCRTLASGSVTQDPTGDGSLGVRSSVAKRLEGWAEVMLAAGMMVRGIVNTCVNNAQRRVTLQEMPEQACHCRSYRNSKHSPPIEI